MATTNDDAARPSSFALHLHGNNLFSQFLILSQFVSPPEDRWTPCGMLDRAFLMLWSVFIHHDRPAQQTHAGGEGRRIQPVSHAHQVFWLAMRTGTPSACDASVRMPGSALDPPSRPSLLAAYRHIQSA